MGKKKKSENQNPKPKEKEELLSTLEDFTKKENWDKFFTLRGSDDSFEWYAEWPQFKPSLLPLLSSNSHILVPGCGNSRLSEHLYDAGFHDITNLDFSKVVISDMLRRNVRDRPLMRWRVMDITSIQFADRTFDVVLDKGGLDALMEPEFGSKLGDQYLSEVKRVLKTGGNFVCLTLAESHVLGLLFPKFRFGWEMTIHCIPQKPSSKPSLNTFMVVAVKGDSSAVDPIRLSFDDSSIDCNSEQGRGFRSALQTEKEIRNNYLAGSDTIYSLEDLKLGAKGDLMELSPGRRVQLTLGGDEGSLFRYRAVVLDAQPESPNFSYHCAVFLVPKTRVHEWLFSSEEGQWMVVESAKTARLIIIMLDSSHADIRMEEIQKDLSPLVKMLEPAKHDSGALIPFMTAGDGIKHRKIVHQVTSEFTGPMIVEDVIYENIEEHLVAISPLKEPVFRRLTFQRTEGLVQSEALLISKRSETHADESGGIESITTVKSKKKEKQKAKQSEQSIINELSDSVKVDHTFVASSYHTGIVAGFTLILSYLESMASSGGKVETVVIGLGAGLLPMFLHSCMHFLQVEAVELDPVVLRLAKEYFDFSEDDRLKVHLADGIQFLKNLTNSSLQKIANGESEETIGDGSFVASSGSHLPIRKLDIIVVDVDSSDSSSGLSCPAADFVEDSFFATVKDVLSEQGLFIINLVSRSPSIKEMVISRMRTVFSHLYSLQLEEDVNEVLFAVHSNMTVTEQNISEAATQLQKLLKLENPERRQSIANMATKIRCLK